VQEVERYYKMPVVSIANLDDLVDYLRTGPVIGGQRGPGKPVSAKYGCGTCVN